MASTSTIVLVLAVLGVSLGRDIRESPIVKIVDGHSMDIEHARYMAAILKVVSWPNDLRLVCGGTIIHPRFILTSAQCLTEELDDMVIIVGSSTLTTGETREVYEVAEVFIHDSDLGYDIGLIMLDREVIFSPTVDMIKLADDAVLTPANFVGNVTGWGATSNTSAPSEELSRLPMIVMNSAECERHFNTFSSDKEICLWRDNRGPCFGDAGGPFIADDLQIGVISKVNTCGTSPTLVVKVAPHLEWIDTIVNENR